MQIFEILDDDGRLVGLEINRFPLGRRGVCRVVRSIPRVRVRKAPRFLSWFSEEPFCVFELNGELYVASNRAGEEGRFRIAPKTPAACSQMERVRDAFLRR
ncbi:MAG: hypothetical protein IRZ00_13910 [Gemmatimonadetes bacterium]|nr:hypothetical protein [Gemmatimonadota bacterium]